MDDYTDNAATFGDRLALAREWQGMSAAQLARRIGLKVGTIQNWEADRSEPRANKLQMLAGLLNVSIVWLLTGEGEGAPFETEFPATASSTAVSEVLDEMRDLRMLNVQISERMSRLEKRMREIDSAARTDSVAEAAK